MLDVRDAEAGLQDSGRVINQYNLFYFLSFHFLPSFLLVFRPVRDVRKHCGQILHNYRVRFYPISFPWLL